jgi:hypothetical protein
MGDADEVDEGRISTESGRGARLLDGGGMKGTRVSSSSIERNCPVGWYREEGGDSRVDDFKEMGGSSRGSRGRSGRGRSESKGVRSGGRWDCQS